MSGVLLVGVVCYCGSSVLLVGSKRDWRFPKRGWRFPKRGWRLRECLQWICGDACIRALVGKIFVLNRDLHILGGNAGMRAFVHW